MLTKLFYFTDNAHYAILLHWHHSPRCFTSLLLKWYLWLCSLHCFTSLLLRWNIWLRSLRCFTSQTALTALSYFTTIKMKSLTMLTALFYFNTTNPRDRTIITTLLLFLIHQMVDPQEFQCFHEVCMCHSNLTVRKFSGVLNALLSQLSSFSSLAISFSLSLHLTLSILV